MKNKRLKNFAERLFFSEISISFGENGIISEPERTLTRIIPISLYFPLYLSYSVFMCPIRPMCPQLQDTWDT
jgi:hypothetical protein